MTESTPGRSRNFTLLMLLLCWAATTKCTRPGARTMRRQVVSIIHRPLASISGAVKVFLNPEILLQQTEGLQINLAST
jgi:hypothetical protein